MTTITTTITKHRYTEKVNPDRIKKLTQLPTDILQSLLFTNSRGKIEDDAGREMTIPQYTKCMKKLFNELRLHPIQVREYKFSEKLRIDGRLFCKGFGIQSLKSSFRGYLCGEFYNDFDMKNAHPTILYYLMKTYYPAESFTRLKHYIENREDVLKSIGGDRSKAKDKILISMNSNKKAETNAFSLLSNLDAEFKKAQDLLFDEESDFTRKHETFKGLKKQNKKGSFLNVCCCIVEKEILLKAIDCFEKNKVSTLMFDGFHLDKSIDIDEALKKLNESSSEYGIEWAVKPPSNKLDTLDHDDYVIDDSEVIPYEDLKEKFEKTHFMISNPVLFGREYMYEGKPTYCLYSKKDFSDLVAPYKCLYENDKGKIITGCIIKPWLEDLNKRCYKHLDFIPSRDFKTTETYNTFRGFECDLPFDYENDETESKKVINIFDEHLMVLTDNDTKSAEYLKQYIADIIQNPQLKPSVAILLKSKQGFGKDLLIDIISEMLGYKYLCRTENIKDILGDFNTPIKDKIILQLNELEGKDGYNYKEKLKGLITAERININEKSIKQYSQMNYSRIFIMSNRRDPIEIDPHDRRYVVFRSTYKKPNKEYFNELATLKEKSRSYILYNYLLNYKLNINFQVDRPITKAYSEMKENNINPIYSFLNQIFNNDSIQDYYDDEEYKTHKKNGDVLINSLNFIRGYKQYLQEIDHRHITPSFNEVKKLLNEIDIEKKDFKIQGKVNKFYVFKIDEVKIRLNDMDIKNHIQEIDEDEWE